MAQGGSSIVTCQLETSDGIFNASSGSLHQPDFNGLLTATFSVPYDTPIQFRAEFYVGSTDSPSITSSGLVKITVPPGTTMTSASGSTYSAPAAQNATVPLPLWSLLALGIALIGINLRSLNSSG